MVYFLASSFIVLLICSTIIIYLALSNFDSNNPKTISYIVAQKEKDLRVFRAATIFGVLALSIVIPISILPKVKYGLSLAIIYGGTYTSALLLSMIPDKSGKDIIQYSPHNMFAWIVGIGAVTTTTLLSFTLDGGASFAEFALLILMLTLSLAAIANRKKFVYYELIFITASHISVFVAAISLN